jgi:hypothetical protein
MCRKVRGYRFKTFLLALFLVLGLAGVSSAAEFWLQMQAFTKTMPGGEIVTIWGFARCTDGTYATCDAPSSPGPTLVIPATDDAGLTIHVKNNLTGLYTEPVSLTIPGQGAATMIPVRNADGRVRSFTHEAAVGATADYIWPTFKPGTFLYQTATHPGLQIPMGLSGVVKKDAVAGQVYTGIPYDNEVVLVFSEVDPAIHKAVETGNYGPTKAVKTTTNYNPRYFLINGDPFTYSRSAIPAGSVGQVTLLRFLNAGADDYTPVLQGQHMTVVAEDGNPLVFPREQYSLLLPAARTFDAIFTPLEVGYLPLYDRRLHLYNAGVSPGGMMVYLDIAAPTQFTLTVTNPSIGGRIVASSLPAGIDCGSGNLDCSETYHANTQLALTATAAHGGTFLSWTGVDAGTETSPTATVTMGANKTVTASFSFAAVTLLTPNGGEVLASGSPYTIQWGAPVAAVKFKLWYSLDNGTTWVLIADNLTGNSYSWTVPTPPANKPSSRVRVQGVNASNALVGTDRSDTPFAIEVVKVTSPNGGETLTSGAIRTISWTTNATRRPVSKVRLWYTLDGGTTWKLIDTVTSNLGSYDWTVPVVPTPKGKVKVRVRLLDSAGGNIGTDVSNAPFTIQP